MGKEAYRLLRRMAERMSIKRGENYIQQCSKFPKEKVPLRPLEDVRNRNEGLQKANYHLSKDKYLRPRPEDNYFVLLRR